MRETFQPHHKKLLYVVCTIKNYCTSSDKYQSVTVHKTNDCIFGSHTQTHTTGPTNNVIDATHRLTLFPCVTFAIAHCVPNSTFEFQLTSFCARIKPEYKAAKPRPTHPFNRLLDMLHEDMYTHIT